MSKNRFVRDSNGDTQVLHRLVLKDNLFQRIHRAPVDEPIYLYSLKLESRIIVATEALQ
jgi:hypothetical protein